MFSFKISSLKFFFLDGLYQKPTLIMRFLRKVTGRQLFFSFFFTVRGLYVKAPAALVFIAWQAENRPHLPEQAGNYKHGVG